MGHETLVAKGDDARPYLANYAEVVFVLITYQTFQVMDAYDTKKEKLKCLHNV